MTEIYKRVHTISKRTINKTVNVLHQSCGQTDTHTRRLTIKVA